MNEATLQSERVRDHHWLRERLDTIWNQYFPDIERKNEVVTVFGQKSRTRLGSIGMQGWKGVGGGIAYNTKRDIAHGTSMITLTAYFMDPRVPDYVVDATIGHELVHYAHGFHSPHPQLYRHPHQGNIVNKEMYKRGMGKLLRDQKAWLRQQWHIIAPPVKRVRRRRTALSFLSAFGG